MLKKLAPAALALILAMGCPSEPAPKPSPAPGGTPGTVTPEGVGVAVISVPGMT